MATQLYEALGVEHDASTEEIRKAYKRRALQTHPDRLPQGATPAEKSRAEELFRKANNAYEVLIDEQKRRVYDRHGIWPPPEPLDEPHTSPNHEHHHHRHRDHRRGPYGHRHGQFNDPFFDSFGGPFNRPRHPNYVFTDPFALFESILGDLHRHARSDPFFGDQFPIPPPPPPLDFSRHGPRPFSHGTLFDLMERTPTYPMIAPMFPEMDQPRRSHSANYRSSTLGVFGGNGNGTRWVSESRVMRTVNGVTQSVWKRRDSDGNEHVTYSYPDGRERYLVNGIEQASTSERAIPAPGNYPGHQGAPSHITNGREPHPPLSGPYNSANIHMHERERERMHKRMDGDGSHVKKRWWRGHW